MLAKVVLADVIRTDGPHAYPRVSDGGENGHGAEQFHRRRTEIAFELTMAHIRVREKKAEHTYRIQGNNHRGDPLHEKICKTAAGEAGDVGYHNHAPIAATAIVLSANTIHALKLAASKLPPT